MIDWKGISVLITGVSGFIGGRLLQRLIAEGAVVSALCRSAPDYLRFSGLTFNTCIATSTEEIASAIASVRPDVVFHLASHAISQHRPDDLTRLTDSNVLLPMQICDGMARSKCRNIVSLGSAWQHANGPGYAPICLYAATKQAMQDVFQYYYVAEQIRSATLKLFHTYGPGEVRPRLVSLLCEAALSGRTLKMSEGQQVVDLTFIDDVVDALLIAGDHLVARHLTVADHSIASGELITVRALASRIEHISGARLHIEWGAMPYKPLEFFGAVDLGPRLPEWSPRVTLDEGLRRTYTGRSAINNLQT